jgi:FkbM family methyltransferase
MNLIKYLQILIRKFTHKKISYSYGGIDLIITNIFKNLKNGTYVDVGCGHPIKNNNTYLLNKKGWKGINIDLDKDNINLFKIFRKNDHNIIGAVSNKVKEVDLFFYHKKSALNTISTENANFQAAKFSSIIKIKTTTLNQIIANSVFKNKKIDFLSIDVEGSELEVLKDFNFTKYEPKVIVVEYLDLSLSKLEIKNLDISKVMNSDIYELITSKNYTLVNMLHSDLVFVNNNFRD